MNKRSNRYGAIFFVFSIFFAFTIKIFVIGSELPSTDKSDMHNFLLSSLHEPTPDPVPFEVYTESQTKLDTAQKNVQYLSSELDSKKDLVQKEQKKKDTIINVMNKNIGGKLKGKGNVIYEASIANKYPPILQCAIIKQETGDGTSEACRDLNNVGGIFDGNNLRRYKSIDDGIWDMAARVKKYYIDEGITTIEKFGNKYCPILDPKDINGLNKHWIPAVTRNYIKLLNECGGIM